MAAYLNTSSGLSGLLDRLVSQNDDQRKNALTLQGLSAAGIVPQSSVTQPVLGNGLLAENGLLASLLGRAPSDVPPAGVGAVAPPQALALSDTIPGGPGPGAVTASPLAPPGSRPQGIPSMAAMQGVPNAAPSQLSGLFSGVEQHFNLPPGYLAGTMSIEDPSGDPNAVSPTGARGIFQFTGGTAKQYGLTDPTNVMQSTYAAAKLASDNRDALAKGLGRQPTAGELYLAHQQGAGGALALLKNPDAPAGSVVDPKNIRVNGGDPNAPASAFASKWTGRFGQAGMSAQPGFTAPFNGAPVGPNPTQFAQAAPARVQTDSQGYALNPDGTRTQPGFDPGRPGAPPPGLSRRDVAANPMPGETGGTTVLTPAPGGASAYVPPTQNGAFDPVSGTFGKPSGPMMPNPGSGAATGGQRSAAGTSASPIAMAAARAAGVMPATADADPATPSTAPGTAAASSVVAPAVQATAPGAAATQAGFARPTVPQIQALIVNPATRDIGLKLWEQAQTGKNYGFMAGPNGAIVRTDPSGGTASVVIAGAAKDEGYTLKAGETRFQNGKAVATIADPASDNLFDGKSVEGQGLNELVRTGKLSRDQAAQFAAGKTVTDPSTGAVTFMTPQGVFRTVQPQQQGGVVPAPSDAASAPTAGVPAAPSQSGLIPLTPPRVEKFSEQQSNAATYATRMEEANKVLERPEITQATMNLKQRALGSIPVGGNFAVSPEFQQAQQAEQDFVNAVLRRESGAAISSSEFDNARKQYFPQPGDGPEVLKQKAANRATAISGIRNAAGGAYKGAPGAAGSTQPASGSPVRVTSPTDAARLPSGTQILLPDGRVGTVP